LAAGALGLENTMVSRISAVLADNGVSIYYISTCNDDFLLVETSVVARCLDVLHYAFPGMQ